MEGTLGQAVEGLRHGEERSRREQCMHSPKLEHVGVASPTVPVETTGGHQIGGGAEAHGQQREVLGSSETGEARAPGS